MSFIILPSSNTGATISAVATGAIALGSPVVINTDSTVQQVGLTSDPTVLGYGTETTSGTNVNNSFEGAVYDASSGKIVFVYKDDNNSGYGTAVVGTVSGTSISFGTPVVYNSANTLYINVAGDSNGKVLVTYTTPVNTAYGIVGTISGTSISFGTRAVVPTSVGYNGKPGIAYDSGQSKYAIFSQAADGTNFGNVNLGTVSGTSVTFDAGTLLANPVNNLSCAYDSNALKIAFFYRDVNTGDGKCRVGTIAAGAITFGTAATFSTGGSATLMNTIYDATNLKIITAYNNVSTGKVIVGTISGTSISFGTASTFTSTNTQYLCLAYNQSTTKTIIAFTDGTSGAGKATIGTVSGTSITTGTETTFASQAYTNNQTFSGGTGTVIFYGLTSLVGKAIVTTTGSTSNLTSSNYIGLSSAAVTTGQTATIQVISNTNTNQTALSIGKYYYVQLNGTLALTPDTTSVYAGISLSATSLLIKG